MLELLQHQWALPTLAALAAFVYLPRWRWELLSAATMTFWFWGFQWFDVQLITSLLSETGLPQTLEPVAQTLTLAGAVLIIGGINMTLAQAPRIGLRPLGSAIVLYMALCLVASYLPMPSELRALLWVLLIYWSRFFWFNAYALHDVNRPLPGQWRQLSYALPFWSPSDIPYPKGTAYLQRIEARTAAEAAVSQLKGLKLIYWALWLLVFKTLFMAAFYGYGELFNGGLRLIREQGELLVAAGQWAFATGIRIPELLFIGDYFQAFDRCAQGPCLDTWHNWKAIVGRFIEDLLYTAIIGHTIIGIVRLAGFNALRNTVNPVASRSIADFWNRYQYYFKELLVNLFYFPAFLRLKGLRPWLRMYLSVLLAVCFGNFLFHLVRGIDSTIRYGAIDAVWEYRAFFMYTLVLAHGIFLSQWISEQRKGRKGSFERWVITPVVVLGFFCLATVFVDYRRGITIGSQLKFLASLFGLH